MSNSAQTGPIPNTTSRYQKASSYEEIARSWMAPWARELVVLSELQPGEEVVDLACGAGVVGEVATEVLAGSGSAIGIDPDPVMVALAQERGLDVRDGFAEQTDLADESVDLVLCQQGLQYFAEPPAALQDVLRYLRPGGRALFSIWAGLNKNPFIRGQIEAIREHLPVGCLTHASRTQVEAVGGHSGLATLLSDAGFERVALTTQRLNITLPPVKEFYPRMMASMRFADLFDNLSAREKQVAIERLSEFVPAAPRDDSAIATMTAVVAVGFKPGG